MVLELPLMALMAVADKLIKQATGDRSKAMVVEAGLIHLNECEQYNMTLGGHLDINSTMIAGSQLFLGHKKIL
jgi:GMP synthase (glutamine-hydrolysing)